MKEMPVIADILVVLLCLLAPALGGSTFLWAKAALFLGAGLLIFAHPSRYKLPRIVFFLFVGLAVIGAFAFLPNFLFGNFEWRSGLERRYEVALPKTMSPQPFISLESWLLMVGTMIWVSYMLTRGVTMRRRALLSIYAGGILALTLVSFFFYFQGMTTDLWRPLNGKFGFFPNRNHTANVLALGGIITLALAYDAFTRRRKIAWFWAASYVVIAVALVINYSRAGVIFFFLGSAAWFVWITWQTRHIKRMAVGGSALLMLLAVFLLFGGKTLERFVGEKPESSMSFRKDLQKDALRLIRDVWWRGVGLGNFEPVFAGYRKSSAYAESRALHPESDWIMAAAEMGIFGPILAAWALVYILWKRWPRPSESSFHLRAAATVCVILFAVHGFVDVPGHRFGALFPALFLLSMTQRDEEIDTFRPWIGVTYRFAAFLLCVLGMGWIMDAFGPKRYPTSAAVYSAKQEIISAYDNARHAEVIAAATRGLKVAPLDWYFYYNRGLAQAWILSTPDPAVADLARAYYLERLWADLPFTEGRVWMSREPELAVAAWSRALDLVRTQQKNVMFQTMLRESSGVPEMRVWLRDLARTDLDNFITFLGGASAEEFQTELDEVLRDDPKLANFSVAQRKAFFEAWRRKGDVNRMATMLQENPEWAADAWMALAESHALKKDFQAAYLLAIKNAPKPALPDFIKPGTTEELVRAVLFEKDFSAGYALYFRNLTEGKPEEALKTLRGFIDNPKCPVYFHYLAAEREAELFSWERAWKELYRYLTLSK